MVNLTALYNKNGSVQQPTFVVPLFLHYFVFLPEQYPNNNVSKKKV